MNLAMGSRWKRFKAIAWEMHTHLGTWYSYLVAVSVTLQASWQDLDQYVPPTLRHWVIGAATVIVVADKAYEAAKRVG